MPDGPDGSACATTNSSGSYTLQIPFELDHQVAVTATANGYLGRTVVFEEYESPVDGVND
ncbi:MAG TPA: hypothetical protein VH143_33820 [Kofleriaceae bacterium]|jgi:hypothetical protein|nr:hypothetical protein [Kofleriaceae bacterium]